MEIMVDGNCRLTLEEALAVGRGLDKLGITWFEEPIDRSDLAGYLALQRELEVPLSAGEAFATQTVVAEEDAYGNIETGDSSTIVTVSPAGGDGPLQGTATAALVRGLATFPGLTEDTAGPLTLDFTAGKLTAAISDAINVASAPATQLVVTTPPTTLVAGQPFTVAVAAEDTYGNVATSYNGDVTISLPGGSGAPVTAQAQSGVATFTGLTVSTTAQGGSIQATAGGLKAVSTPPINVQSNQNAQPPTIIGEQAVMFQKKNKKGKPVGKAVLQGFILKFNTAMNAATAGAQGNYLVTATSTKHAKKKKAAPPPEPVAVSARYDVASQSVTLTLLSKQAFAKGGEITVIYSPPGGVSSVDGTPLSSDDAKFTIAPKGKGVTAG